MAFEEAAERWRDLIEDVWLLVWTLEGKCVLEPLLPVQVEMFRQRLYTTLTEHTEYHMSCLLQLIAECAEDVREQQGMDRLSDTALFVVMAQCTLRLGHKLWDVDKVVTDLCGN